MLRVSVDLDAVMSSVEDGDIAHMLFEGPGTDASTEALAVVRTALAAANARAESAAPPDDDDEVISSREIELTPRGPAFVLMAWEEDGPSEPRVGDYLDGVGPRPARRRLVRTLESANHDQTDGPATRH